MDVVTLKSNIQSKHLDNFYIFTGEEWYVQKLYLQQMAKRVGSLQYVDDSAQLFSALNKKALFKVNSVYVLRDDAEIIKNPETIDKLRKTADKNIVVLVLSSVDKRTKLYKTYKDTFIEFNTLEHAILKRHIQSQIALSSRNIDKLIEVCESNYGRILLEIDKILDYEKVYSEESADDCFRILLEEGTIFQPSYDAIFNFVDDTLMHRVNMVYDSLDNCKRIGESSLALLSVLYNNAKQVLQVQSYDGDNIEKATGLTAYQIKRIRQKCNVYRTGDLVYMLKLIRDTEVGIKTGSIEEAMAVDYVLANIL